MNVTALFAIADLHFSCDTNKPMDVFGARWADHTNRIIENWRKCVLQTDTVVIAGDVSWGDGPENSENDFRLLASLPGRKIVCKGNHDYWWRTASKLDEFRDSLGITDLFFMRNNAFETEEYIICGGKGYLPEPGSAEGEKLAKREAIRLALSIAEGEKLRLKNPDKKLLVFLHYPPAYGALESAPICQVLAEHRVSHCFYGHIHNADTKKMRSSAGGALLSLISSDFLSFSPLKITL